MTLKSGDTFLLPLPKNSTHLFVVISNPQESPKEILIVPIMSWRVGKDESCILELGDHPFVVHKSYINYHSAQKCEAERLEPHISDSQFKPLEAVSDKLLARIRQGADLTMYLSLDFHEILVRQGLVQET